MLKAELEQILSAVRPRKHAPAPDLRRFIGLGWFDWN